MVTLTWLPYNFAVIPFVKIVLQLLFYCFRRLFWTKQSLYTVILTTGGYQPFLSLPPLCVANQVIINCFILFFCSLNSDVASGKDTSDGYESLASGGKGDGKPRKHHRKSARTRSRQERTSKPKLSMLNVCPACDRS